MIQNGIVCILIATIAILSVLTHQKSKFLFNVLTSMSNVASTLPYLFLVGAFPYFKKRNNLERPFEAFHSRRMMNNGFTIIQPFITKDWVVATATIAGPLLFGSFAW